MIATISNSLVWWNLIVFVAKVLDYAGEILCLVYSLYSSLLLLSYHVSSHIHFCKHFSSVLVCFQLPAKV